MPFTEFACRSGGSNLNAGTRTGSSTEPGTAADFTYASGTWVNATSVFTVATGNPSSDGVAIGDFVSVYVDGSTVTGFVGRVSAVSTTTITVHATAIAGTKPADGTSNRTLKVGGAWQGPNGASGFPFNFAKGDTLTNVAGDALRVNFKNNATYAITAAMTHTQFGPTFFQGYTTSYGDFGRATIDGGNTGASYVLLTLSGSAADRTILADLIFQRNGATGSATGITSSGGARGAALRCVVNSVRGTGFADVNAIECEAYACNQSNTGNLGGFTIAAGTVITRCISHHNTAGVNAHGFYAQSAGVLLNCVSAYNSGSGYVTNNITSFSVLGCDFIGNGVDGLRNATGQAMVRIENCNFIGNAGWGINVSSGSFRGYLFDCGFGSNTLGDRSTGVAFMDISGTVTYGASVYPWIDPVNGDFRIRHDNAKSAGRGSFTQTYASWSAPNTVAYPDIGAAQHQDMAVQPTYGVGI